MIESTIGHIRVKICPIHRIHPFFLQTTRHGAMIVTRTRMRSGPRRRLPRRITEVEEEADTQERTRTRPRPTHTREERRADTPNMRVRCFSLFLYYRILAPIFTEPVVSVQFVSLFSIRVNIESNICEEEVRLLMNFGYLVIWSIIKIRLFSNLITASSLCLIERKGCCKIFFYLRLWSSLCSDRGSAGYGSAGYGSGGGGGGTFDLWSFSSP